MAGHTDTRLGQLGRRADLSSDGLAAPPSAAWWLVRSRSRTAICLCGLVGRIGNSELISNIREPPRADQFPTQGAAWGAPWYDQSTDPAGSSHRVGVWRAASAPSGGVPVIYGRDAFDQFFRHDKMNIPSQGLEYIRIY